MSGVVKKFTANSSFFGTAWIDRKDKKIYILPVEKTEEKYEIVTLLDPDIDIDILNEVFVLDNYKYSSRLKKLYNASIRRTKRLIDARTKWKVLKRYDFKCSYCGYNDGPLTYDHFLPVAMGGTTTEQNGRSACELCNNSKRDMDPYEWLNSQRLSEIKELRNKQ